MKKLLTLIAAMTMCNAYGEDVYWFVDGDVYETTACNSGDNVTMPTKGAPQKEGGFRFIGWKELTEPTSWKEMLFFNFSSYTPTRYGTSATTWTATGDYGTLTGSWRCSSTSATENTDSCWQKGHCTTNSNPSTSGTTQNCWCKGTKATFNGSTTNMSSSLAWTFQFDANSASNCASNCARDCAIYVKNYPGFRRAVFGVAGQ